MKIKEMNIFPQLKWKDHIRNNLCICTSGCLLLSVLAFATTICVLILLSTPCLGCSKNAIGVKKGFCWAVFLTCKINYSFFKYTILSIVFTSLSCWVKLLCAQNGTYFTKRCCWLFRIIFVLRSCYKSKSKVQWE